MDYHSVNQIARKHVYLIILFVISKRAHTSIENSFREKMLDHFYLKQTKRRSTRRKPRGYVGKVRDEELPIKKNHQ